MSRLRVGKAIPARIRSRLGGRILDDQREGGQIIVLFALTLVVMLAFAALVVDLGVLRNNRQTLVNAMDAGALAGGFDLPLDGTKPGDQAALEKLVDVTVAATYPGISKSEYTISYRCLIGVDSNDNPYISRDIPTVCNPPAALGHAPLPSDFTGAGATRSSACDPSGGDLCNAVVVTGATTTQYGFAGVLGINDGSTGAVQSVSCKGPCGNAPLALNDVELVIDKSGSMGGNYSGTPSEPRIYWAKLAANQLVTDLADNGGIGATGNQVGITTFSGTTASSDATAWTSTAAGLATTINAITPGGNTPTALGMQTATADLIAHARNPVRGKVQRVVIFVSDGRPNPDLGPNGLPATSATNNQRPTQADIDAYLGSADIAYSILIGTSPYYYAIGQGPPLSADINDPDMMKLLATPDNLTAVPPQIYYYNVVDASGLPSVFHQIAGQILGSGAHLIQLYPTPVVTSASGPTTAVVITGQYFTGLTSVTVGGAAWPVVTSTDTSITVTHPASPPWTPGAQGTKVGVIVTTPGGTSPITSADQYTWP
jgi:hypothetical protein